MGMSGTRLQGLIPCVPKVARCREPHATWSLGSSPICYQPNGVVSRYLLCMAIKSLHLHDWQRLCRSQSTRWDSDQPPRRHPCVSLRLTWHSGNWKVLYLDRNTCLSSIPRLYIPESLSIVTLK